MPDLDRTIIRACRQKGGIRTETSVQWNARDIAMSSKDAKRFALVRIVNMDRGVGIGIDEQKVFTIGGKLQRGRDGTCWIVKLEFEKRPIMVLPRVVKLNQSVVRSGMIVRETKNETLRIIRN